MSVENLKEPLPSDSPPVQTAANGDLLCTTAIVAGAFRMEEDTRLQAGSVVQTAQGQQGEMRGPFAKMGKCKVIFRAGLSAAAQEPAIQSDILGKGKGLNLLWGACAIFTSNISHSLQKNCLDFTC